MTAVSQPIHQVLLKSKKIGINFWRLPEFGGSMQSYRSHSECVRHKHKHEALNIRSTEELNHEKGIDNCSVVRDPIANTKLSLLLAGRIRLSVWVCDSIVCSIM